MIAIFMICPLVEPEQSVPVYENLIGVILLPNPANVQDDDGKSRGTLKRAGTEVSREGRERNEGDGRWGRLPASRRYATA